MKLLIFLSALFFSSTLLAQNAFTKAVLYKTDGTRLDGYIKNTNYEGTQQSFEYSTYGGGKTTRIDAKDLMKVEFADGMILENHFISITSMSISLLSRRETDYELPDYKVNGPFMIEKMINGSYALYQFVDRFDFPHFFYRMTTDTSIQKLEYKEYVDETAGLINKREFRNQLLFLAANAGCENKLAPVINRTEYKLQHMIPVFKELNKCVGENVGLNNQLMAAGTKLRFTVNAGIAATDLTVPSPSQSSYPGLTPGSFSSKVGPLLGASMEIIPQKRQKNYIVSIDALYHSYTAETDSLHPNAYTTGFGYIKFSAFNISPNVRFRVTKTTIAPFVEAGFSYRILAKNEDYYYTKNNISSVENRKEIFSGKSTSLAYLGGVGVDFKRFSIHARYSLPANKENTYYSTLFLMVKFVLAKKAN